LNLAVRSRPEVDDDLKALPDDELRRIAIQIIVSLGQRPYQGKLLRGSLSDCRKVYFDHDGVTERPGYRVVYRLRPNETGPEEVDVISVGPRGGLAVYHEALQRLGR
jgi:mRNA-degrading endonuclease RelE of RelBE toxin-antitoxin system